MRRTLVALLALLPASYATTTTSSGSAGASTHRSETPRGEAVFRADCFSQDLDGELSRLGSGLAAGPSFGGSTGTNGTPTTGRTSAAPVLTAPPPPESPANDDATVEAIVVQGDSAGRVAKKPKSKKNKGGGPFGMSKSSNSVAEPPPPMSAPVEELVPMPEDEAVYAEDDLGGADATAVESTTRGAPLTKDFLDKVPAGRSYQNAVEMAEGVTGTDEAQAQAQAAAVVAQQRAEEARATRQATGEEKRVAQKVLDWGARTFLSNDDSMSLASAQRVLYSVMNGLSLSPAEIRPHELLNYFSFDTVTPDADQLFDVLASAEQDGDTLSLALAVRGGTPPRQALDLTLVVDRSCSMEDEGRMDYTKRALTQMSEQLEDGDRVDIVLFDDIVCVPLENWVEGRDDPEMLRKTIAMMQPEGATDLDLGLREGYRVAQSHLDTRTRNRRVMVVTDALLNSGDVDPNTVSEIGKAFDDEQIRLTGVGVGREFDDGVLDMLTEKGKGAYVYLGSEAVVDRLFGPDGFRSLTETIAHDVQFSLTLPDSLAMERFYGEEASTVAADIQPINYYTGTSQLFLQDLVIKGRSPDRSDVITLTVTYRDALTGEPEKRTFKTTLGVVLDADPHNVRKGLALMAWSDVLLAKAMGADPCGAELDAYAARAARLPDDAEMAFVNGLVERECGRLDLPTAVSAAQRVPYKVRVDADVPIAEVELACAGQSWSEQLTGSDSVARFDAVPGRCEVTLAGQIPMTARVEVPETGGNLRCIVRGGRLSCS